MPDVTRWSIDPGSNDLIDTACPWPEDMPRPQVNDSARGMMAALAAWFQDNSGTLTLGGGSTAYTVTTNQDIASITPRVSLAFVAPTPNAGPATLSVNGLAAKPIRRRGNLELAPGDLASDVVYRVVYVAGYDAFLVVSPHIERPGVLLAQAHAAQVSGWLLCDGRAVSRTTYAALFASIGATYGPGDGSTTFNIPDLRGRVPFGADALGGTSANRLTSGGGVGGGLGASGGHDYATLTPGQMPSHTHGATMAAAGALLGGTTGAAGGHDHGGLTAPAGGHSHTGAATEAGGHTHSGTAAAGGAHTHDIQNTRAGVTGGSAALFVSSIGPGGANTVSSSEAAGNHTHPLTINPSGDHTHPLAVDPAPEHRHGIAAVNDHTHTYPGVPDHTHAITVQATGGSDPLPLMPPALVVAYAIKA